MSLADEPIEIRHSGEPLSATEAAELAGRLEAGWSTADGRLSRTFEFPDFAKALEFVNKVGSLAEEVDHHPLITFTWGKVDIEIWTHSIGGLQRGDFVWAARVEGLYSGS